MNGESLARQVDGLLYCRARDRGIAIQNVLDASSSAQAVQDSLDFHPCTLESWPTPAHTRRNDHKTPQGIILVAMACAHLANEFQTAPTRIGSKALHGVTIPPSPISSSKSLCHLAQGAFAARVSVSDRPSADELQANFVDSPAIC